jgi:CRP-like cAMP-binding protein
MKTTYDPRQDLDPRANQKNKQRPKFLNRDVYYAGIDVVLQGDEGFRAYYIEKGRVEVLVEKDGRELKVAELGPGDIFGEMALINNEPRSATVRTMDDCTLTVISRDEIEGKIRRIDDKAIRALINVLAERLKESTQGQFMHYKNLADFQERVQSLMEKAQEGMEEKKRADFRRDVEPLLKDLQGVLDKYKG